LTARDVRFDQEDDQKKLLISASTVNLFSENQPINMKSSALNPDDQSLKNQGGD
jgi:hypothetical protein